ncbi:MAG: NUDIX hydrolase [Pseudomonadales bacterium]
MRERFRTARCILYRGDEYLLAVHSSFRRSRDRRWGLPGGQIEWGETPRIAAQRELKEELEVVVPELIEVGAYSYKRALHMVYAAPLTGEIGSYDSSELLAVQWFTEADVAALQREQALHANYELEAIRRLKRQLGT